ncbi:dna polymerase beta [Ophiostoma piceae UAMH 11346]|uniref:DNA polymerase n=1 Tax=Ophiostoma piceae (strain UAMH 11346) TaxID=1262450 RepID=S3C9E6_OPHP1|nr:dna polymerase beta [Ophiostoma piceae UAMH 11346]
MASNLDLPTIYLLGAVSEDERSQLAGQVSSLTKDANKADFFVGKVAKTERAKFELRRLGVITIDERQPHESRPRAAHSSGPEAKRQKRDGPVPEAIVISSSSEDESTPTTIPQGLPIKVVKLAWLTESLARGEVLPLDGYVVYEGRKVRAEPTRKRPAPGTSPQETAASRVEGILRRAQNDLADPARAPSSSQHQRQTYSSPTQGSHRRTYGTAAQPPALVRTTTSENDYGLNRVASPIPDYLHTIYSCQRPTPIHPPNEKFVDQLKKIRTARQLTGDKIGIRAYSTAIATISAYPYEIHSPSRISQLPGCGPKIEDLYREFQSLDGHVREADDDETSSKLASLRIFFNIMGVAEATARSFYNRGWRDLDDVIEFGWKDLTRVQQIGVKYYEELQELIARPQVEAIADKVLAHANAIQPGYQMIIAGGYRRGKELSGDVDIIISHHDESATNMLIGRLVLSLEQDQLITHTLILSTANSDRGQEAVSWKGNAPRHGLTSGKSGGSGFDTLDKAMVVWQDPMETGKKVEDATDSSNNDGKPPTHNTNPHRRVDIIISPWRTVGCAVLGWTGGTTFQRDLRRYCKYQRGLRFDSSGARSTDDGTWVDLENYEQDPAPDMLTAERRVFDALQLEYRPPTERCTG